MKSTFVIGEENYAAEIGLRSSDISDKKDKMNYAENILLHSSSLVMVNFLQMNDRGLINITHIKAYGKLSRDGYKIDQHIEKIHADILRFNSMESEKLQDLIYFADSIFKEITKCQADLYKYNSKVLKLFEEVITRYDTWVKMMRESGHDVY